LKLISALGNCRLPPSFQRKGAVKKSFNSETSEMDPILRDHFLHGADYRGTQLRIELPREEEPSK